MVKNRVLLKKPTILKVGDVIEEVNRFKPTKPIYYQLIEYKPGYGIKLLDVITGRVVGGDYDAMYNDFPSVYLTYLLLPNHPIRVLYGKT